MPMDAFAEEVGKEDFHLARACLLLAQDERPGVDPDAYLRRFAPWADEVGRRAASEGMPAALRGVLALQVGFRGNAEEFYDPENAYLDRVLDTRFGIPITLSVVYLEIARRLGKPLVAVGMPGHFLVRHEETLIDPFHGGRVVTEEDCARIVDAIYGGRMTFSRDMLRPTPDRDVLARVITNLKAVYAQRGDTARAIRAVDHLLQVNPMAFEEFRDRGLLKLSVGDPAGRADLSRYLDALPKAPDADAVRRLLR